MSQTKIEWTDETWNIITGCDKISPGCQNCYAAKMSKRLAGRYGYPKDDPFKVTFHPDKLYQPQKWKKPRRIFVCSMGDLFHKNVPFNHINQVFNAAFHAPQHTYIVLTKRPDIMQRYFESCRDRGVPVLHWERHGLKLWKGVTAENQEQADKRIPVLLQIPAKVRFVSVEPMLSQINFFPGLPDFLDFSYTTDPPRIDWVICGGESGSKARPTHPDWARLLRDQCEEAGTPFFFKQWGEWLPFDQRVAGQISNSEGFKRNKWAWKTGKKIAGRLLDNKLWDQFPE